MTPSESDPTGAVKPADRTRAYAWLQKTSEKYYKSSPGCQELDGLVQMLHAIKGGRPLTDDEIRDCAFGTCTGLGWDPPTPEPGDGDDADSLMALLEVRLEQLGSKRVGHNRWRCPACGKDSLSIGRGKKGLMMQCFTKGTCSTDRVLREIGWTSRQLFYTEHRKSDWSTLLDRDLFGRPPQDNRALRDNTHSSSSCRTTRANSPKESIEDRVLSRDARAVVTAERLDPSDGEEQLARGEIELDQRLQHGALPARATPSDIQVAGVMLRLFQLSVAIGEYRELPRSIRRIAADCGWDVAARNRVSKVMQRLVDAGTFSRRELEPTQGHPRRIFCYSLPVSANQEFLESLDQEQQSAQPLEQSALGVQVLAEPALELESEDVV